MVVRPEPLGGNLLDLLDAFENVQVQPFVPDSTIVTLDIGVLLGLTGLDVLNGNALLLSPYSERLADVFGVSLPH